jgi:transcriptional regulator with XRE-family HTH domain
METEMAPNWEKADLLSLEAEENLLLDFQFMLQELIHDKDVSRAELAKRTGISKARLSQIMSSEANPTLKTCARLLHALGEELRVTVKKKPQHVSHVSGDNSDWQVDVDDSHAVGRKRATVDDSKWIALLKEAMVSNDNYRNQVEIWEGGPSPELQAA